MKLKLLASLLLIFFITSCNSAQQAPAYDDMKKMITDSMQTEEGKKAFRQLFDDQQFREQLIFEHAEIQKAIEQTLLSEEGQKFWKKIFEDPIFTEKIAKSMKEQQQEVMKELIKDASFQKDLQSFFSQTEMQKQLEEILKSATMKEHYQKAIEETIQSPLLQEKWQKLIQEAGASKEQDKKQDGGGDKGKSKSEGG